MLLVLLVALELNPIAPGLAPSDALIEKLDAALAAKGPGFHPHTRHLDKYGHPLFTNRLILESSPYLLQHANNPVSWYAWGDEPFARAAREHKPVLLSIGYSTCHWCHVMERESFEDPEVARVINQDFIAVKVDREERPDLDAIYLAAVEALTGDGGWPMTVALTPARKPFFGGTYFPRAPFLQMLAAVKSAYSERPEQVATLAKQLTDAIQKAGRPEQPKTLPGAMAIRWQVEHLARDYDAVNGGFGKAPKFPKPVELELLLRYHRRTGDPQALRMVVHTLESMAAGGIHDQLGGGFHRYSTDEQWLKPHFEKMLYDNAQLASLYLEAWQVTGRADFARVTRETLEYVLREMTDAGGGFWSASDADSPAPGGAEVEGYFFTWTLPDLEAVLGERATAAAAALGVSAPGELDGRSILRQVSELPGEDRQKLLLARSHREPPMVDHKLLPSSNGLMISALARAGFAFGEPRYLDAAARAATAVLANLNEKERFLDDLAALEQGLLELHEATRDQRWLSKALELQKTLDSHFRDGKGGYFLTSNGAKGLLVREKPAHDGVIPSGNSMAALNLLRLSELTGNAGWRKQAVRTMEAFAGQIPSMPAMLGALDWTLDRALEVVLVVPPGQSETELTQVVRRAWLPNAVHAIAEDGKGTGPLFEGRHARKDKAVAYVCRSNVCGLPTSDAPALAEQLAKADPF
jgi:uncharacterized protein YyaL (SSP411 family)